MKDNLKILITNDDGYMANGLRTLARIMDAFGEVTVVAPKFHQSAMSMAVSLGFKKLAAKELPELGPGSWSYLDATPASCVKFGLEYKYPSRNPDVVVTGINHGSNAATAANYSATLGAAEEGAINGIRAIGVSVSDFNADGDLTAVERYFPGIFRFLMDNWPEGYGHMYNVNFPKCPVDEIRGIRFARQGRAHWVREFQSWDKSRLGTYFVMEGHNCQVVDPPLEEGETAYMMIGDFIDDEPATADADHRLNLENWITITPNNLDRTDFEDLARLKSIAPDGLPLQ